MLLFFDTETTGLPRNWNAPVTDLRNWPRLVQLAWLLYDESGQLLASGNEIVLPDGFIIPSSAAAIHRITQEIALAEGKPVMGVLQNFSEALLQAQYLVAHNISFDEKIVGAEYLRLKQPNLLAGKQKICTMLTTTNFCRIPNRYGYKWPTVDELHRKVFGRSFQGAHNALADITATADSFWELRRQGALFTML